MDKFKARRSPDDCFDYVERGLGLETRTSPLSKGCAAGVQEPADPAFENLAVPLTSYFFQKACII